MNDVFVFLSFFSKYNCSVYILFIRWFSHTVLDLGSLFNKYPNNYYQNQRPYNNYNGNGYYPQTGVSSSGYYPQSGGGYYPGSNTGGGYYPGSNTGYGTNILGSGSFGGGYGGYGGYGGNGGLPSYIGYNNQNYNGKRNLGFGYYHGTNSYGLIPSREMGYTPGTGYRGYN